MQTNETQLQKRIHKLISDPSKVFITAGGKRLQFLSPGYINKHEGPDFRDVAVLLNGAVIICDCEFHRNSSDWIQHNHSNDPVYSNVGIHIVFNNDATIDASFETVVINPDELPMIENFTEINEKGEFIDTLEELQNYALLRLLRKTSEARILLNHLNIKEALKTSIHNYLSKYYSRKHRPFYKNLELDEFISALTESELLNFLTDLEKGKEFNIPERLFRLMKTKYHKEGNHIRREIFLNCLLPLSLAISNEEQRISLFVWFWSTPALNSYGILTRKFKNIPQDFIWQQQGMLEILNFHYRGEKISPNKFWKIGEVLHFFQIGNPPFK